MAESILLSLAGAILAELGCKLALRDLGSILHVNDQLEKLKDTVSAIKVAVVHAESQKHSTNNTEKNWLSKLKDVFYDVDDLIDEFSYESLRRQVMTQHRTKTKEVRIFFSKSNQIAFGLEMGRKVKKIREKIDLITASKTQFVSESVRYTRDDGLNDRQYSHSFISQEEVIGRDDDKRAIVKLLIDTNADDISVISIVGIGGLGKTALAQYIYNDEKITNYFDLKLWVCISENFDVKIIVEKIIESATNERSKPLEMDLLQSKLRKKIGGKKYLLIMDDLWNENHTKWVELKRLLMGGAKGSRILITTRSEQVAKTFDTTSLYSLKTLDEDDSWLLFEKMAFKGKEELENPNLIRIGKKIVTKLKGIPLAIRTIGRLLYSKNTEVDWLSFNDNELNIAMQEENEMKSILELSYNHLPFHLKQCFAYCALFPKDYLIQKDELIKQWIAQKFVQLQPHDKNMEVEEIGNKYFMELSWRLFFQDITKNKWGDIINCKMHDFMHDLACSVLENECLLTTVDANLPFDKRIRHMSFESKPDIKFNLPNSFFEENHLRTFLLQCDLPSYSITDHNKPLLEKMFSKLSRLRTLNLNTGWIAELPNSISKLKHLRYLDLSRNSFLELLPNSITELYHLETLILSSCQRLRELPKDTANLISLRHLDMRDCCHLTHMPKGMGVLTSLQTMNLFVLAKDDDSGLSELMKLNNLKGSLTIRGLKFCRTVDLQMNANYLNLKSYLQKLELDWTQNDYEKKPKRKIDAVNDSERVLECLQPHSNVRKIHISQYQGMRLSDWFSHNSLNRLVTIRLSSCEGLQRLPRFDQFPSLKHLVLQSLTSIEYIDDGNNSLYSSIFFPSLEKLSIHDMPKLKRWWKGEKSSLQTFPCLSKLEIVNCCELTSIPLLPPLWSLKMDGVGMQLMESMIMKSSSPMSILHSLCLSRIEDLEFLPHEFFYNLEILEFLLIQDCNNLRMPFSHANEKDAGVRWRKLASLCSLTFDGIPKLECLPKGLQHVTTLRFLRLQNCANLTSLPEWIGNLTSLKTLNIHDCPKLTSLPEGTRNLTSLSQLNIYNCCNLASLPDGMIYLHSLQSLTIGNCPKLLESCKKEKGKDWLKIVHVPELFFS